jgi:type I restriction enzyme M protein
LSVKNPNAPEAAPLRKPQAILEEIRELDNESESILDKIKALI